MSLNESHVEAAALDWFQELGYAIAHGPRLSTQHDTLLSKLLSGELRLEEI